MSVKANSIGTAPSNAAMQRAVIYARYSDAGQTEQSIEGQVDDCNVYAISNNYDVVSKYIDRAKTGRSDDRDAFQQMLADAKLRKFDVVLVWKLDRFSRNLMQSVIYEDALNKYGVKLISVMEPAGEGASGGLSRGMLRVIAQFYSDDLREKVERGMRKTAEKGFSTGGRAPIGYRIDKQEKKLVIDDQFAPIIKKAFELYASGVTVQEICKSFNDSGMRTPTGTLFTHNAFDRAFRNEKYIGVYSYDGQYRCEGGVPAIIDNETFATIQRRLAQNQTAPGRSAAKIEYFLSTKIFCGYCSKPMTGECVKKNDKQYGYYVCSERKRFHNCKKDRTKKNWIEDIVAAHTKALLTDEFIIELAADVVLYAKQEQGTDGQLDRIARQRKLISEKIENYITAIAAGAISNTLTQALSDAELQVKALEREFEQTKAALSVIADTAQIVAFLKEFQAGDLNDINFKRRLFDVLVNAVYVTDDELKIVYNTGNKKSERISISTLLDSGSPKTPHKQMSFMRGFTFDYIRIGCLRAPERDKKMQPVCALQHKAEPHLKRVYQVPDVKSPRLTPESEPELALLNVE